MHFDGDTEQITSTINVLKSEPGSRFG